MNWHTAYSHTTTYPIGPNFRLSMTIAWKNIRANRMLLNSLPLEHISNVSGVNRPIALFMLALIPRGGSLVTLIHICTIPGRTDATAGSESGSPDKKRRKLSCAVSEQYCSIIFSSLTCHIFIRWMFWRRTHPPFCAMSSIAFSANFSWPWPREIALNFPLSAVKPSCFPRPSTSLTGSTPGERIKNTGSVLLESA